MFMSELFECSCLSKSCFDKRFVGGLSAAGNEECENFVYKETECAFSRSVFASAFDSSKCCTLDVIYTLINKLLISR